MISIEEKKGIARKFLEMLNEQDSAGLFTVCSPEVAEEWTKFFPYANELYPNHHVDVTDMIAEGDKVWCRLATRGGHGATWEGIPATGRQWTNTGIFYLRFADGKIVQFEGLFDSLSLVKQLGGTITPPAPV